MLRDQSICCKPDSIFSSMLLLLSVGWYQSSTNHTFIWFFLTENAIDVDWCFAWSLIIVSFLLAPFTECKSILITEASIIILLQVHKHFQCIALAKVIVSCPINSSYQSAIDSSPHLAFHHAFDTFFLAELHDDLSIVR